MLTNQENNEKMLKLKKIRADKAKESKDNTWRRLRVREVVQEKCLGELKRGVENGTCNC